MHRAIARISVIGFALSAVAAVPAAADTSSPNTASALPSGKRMHKPYTLAAPDAAAAQSAACTAPNVGPVNVASDPEEGGQIARTAKPAVSEIKVVKTTDTASTKLSEAAPAPGTPCAPVQH